MKNILSVLVFLTIFCLSLLANAGTAQTGRLHTVHFMQDGSVIVYTDGTRSDIPSCAASYPTRMVVDGSTEAGKAQISGILAFYLAGKKVYLRGAGDCNAGFSSERILYFHSVE